MTIPHVYHQTLENLIGTSWDDYNEVLKLAYQKMQEDDLLVHVVVLAHGTDMLRLASTTAMLRMLCDEVRNDRIRIWLSYQGERMPVQLRGYTNTEDVELIYQSDKVENEDLPELPTTGKTENILRALKRIYDRRFSPPEQQFVIFLDNDYLLYDAVNVHSLYLPWVLNPYDNNGVDRDHLYVKAGGMRLKLSESLQSSGQLRSGGKPAKFIDICKESLESTGLNPASLEPAKHLIPTRDTLIKELGSPVVAELEAALDVTTRQGARSSRGLSCYLQARRDNPTARFYSEFSFLLHGDQGTSLANWMNANLTPGYGLELSFLNHAIEHYGSAVVNVIGLPHAHHPKGETENFVLGIEMFSLLMELIDGSSSLTQIPFDDTWLYYSPTKLGLKRVAIKQPAKTKFYLPLSKMIKERVAA